MANELKLRLSAALANGSHKESFAPDQLNIDQAAVGAHGPVVDVGTAEEVLSFGDVGTPGWLFLLNLDDTNFVTFGPESGGSMVAFGKLKPGEPAALRIDPAVTLRAQADTASCKVKLLVLED